MIVDDQADAGLANDRLDGGGEAANFSGVTVFGAELDKVRAAVAELAGDFGGVASAQIGGVDEGVEAALGEGLHGTPIQSIHASSRRAVFPGNRCYRRRGGNSGPAKSPARTEWSS